MVILKAAPRAPGVAGGSSVTVPPWASAMRRQKARPRPLPFALVVNRASKMRQLTSGGTPGPSSRTTSTDVAPSRRPSTQTCPLPSIAWLALMSRFVITRAS